MKQLFFQFLCFGIIGLPVESSSQILKNTTPVDREKLIRQNTPYFFIENKGQIIDQNNQTNAAVLYQLALPGMNVSLKKTGFSYDCYAVEDLGEDTNYKLLFNKFDRNIPHKRNYKFHRIDVDFIDVSPICAIEPEGKSGDYSMYYTSGTPEDGTKVYHYKKVFYRNLYDGIDLEFIATPGTSKPVEYNFIVHPGADIARIKMQYSGAFENALKDGSLVMKLAHTELTENIPASWIEETKELIVVDYLKLNQDEESIIIGFNSNISKSNKTLIIDPTPNLDWATYYGGPSDDFVYGVVSDDSGNIYISGSTSSISGIATTGAYLPTGSGTPAVHLFRSAFVSKFNSAGIRLWGTYFEMGGEHLNGKIDKDRSGNIYMVGNVFGSSGSALPPAKFMSHQKVYGGGWSDAFLAKFNSSGFLQWCSFYGGPELDAGFGLAADINGDIVIGGRTTSLTGISSSGAYQTTFAGTVSNTEGDAFLAKFNSSGVRLWGTYYGGNQDEREAFVATDKTGSYYISGQTNSTSGIATSGTHQTTLAGARDIFVAKFNSAGMLQWGTYYGGDKLENWQSLTSVDASGNVYLAGTTNSLTGIASTGAYQTNKANPSDTSSTDVFIVKFNSSGRRQWGTYYGGSENDAGYSIDVEMAGSILVSGKTESPSGIATSGTYQDYLRGKADGFIVKFDSMGIRQWGTYYGGNDDDYCTDIFINSTGQMCIVGQTKSLGGIATVGSHQTYYAGGTQYGDAFLARFSQNSSKIKFVPKAIHFELFPNPTECFINIKTDIKLLNSYFSIFDNTGKSVLSGKILAENTVLNLSVLAPGIYWISVGDNKQETIKIIKE